MSVPELRARRATVDDLTSLRQLWENARARESSLERQLTEFQVVEDHEGRIVGCVGLQIANRQGKVHNPHLHLFEGRDLAQSLLWERIQTLSQNHGLFRLWICGTDSFWSERGFSEPDDDARLKLPSEFGDSMEPWKSLQLRDESATELTLEQQLELFQESQKKMTQRTLRSMRLLRFSALGVAFAVLFALIWLAWEMLNRMAVPDGPSKP